MAEIDSVHILSSHGFRDQNYQRNEVIIDDTLLQGVFEISLQGYSDTSYIFITIMTNRM